MKIKTFGRQDCRVVMDAAKAALDKVAADFGLTVQIKPGRFTPASYAPSFTFLTVADNGIPATFTRDAPLIGMKPEDYGRTVIVGGTTYRITGVNLKKWRYPIQSVNVQTGRTMLFTKEGIVAQLRLQDATGAGA